MTGAPHDLRDYLFDELSSAERAEVEAWLATSVQGREELDRLRLTNQALMSLPDEEIPQRIAFVSDKVFEPSPWARLASWFQLEGPRFAFGMAAAMAVVFVGLWATQPSLRYDAQGFELAFGAGAPTPVPTPALSAVETLTSEQVREVALAVLAEASESRKAELTALIDQRTTQSEQRFAQQVAAVSDDAEMGYRMLRSEIEKMLNGSLAMATR
jgi:anti-sigma factor RsiW